MIVQSSSRKNQLSGPSVLTIGMYDGLHLGHQKILKRVIAEAKKRDASAGMITFWPHPRLILNPDDQSLKLLTTFEEKSSLLDQMGMDFLYKIRFSKKFSQLSADEFVKKFLIERLQVKCLIIGYDHRFGNDRQGDINFLRARKEEYGFDVIEIPKYEVEDFAVSSTKVRNAIAEGDMDLAKSALGRAYSISGKVIKGKQLGRTIGFPTANIKVSEAFKIIPSHGIYAAKLRLGEEVFEGMLYIGTNPTLNEEKVVIEINLFDFDRNIYGRNVEVTVLTKTRQDQKFDDLDQLQAQIAQDKIEVLKILRK